MTIYYKTYDTFSNYEQKIKKVNSDGKYSVNRFDLLKASVMVGLPPATRKKLDKDVTRWKIYNIITFIDTESQFSIKNRNHLEQSEKTTIGYYVGMVFAQIYMQKEKKVRHMLHLKDSNIEVITSGSKRSPDLWGVDQSNQSFLVEAKGSIFSRNALNIKSIKNAKDQLDPVKGIKYSVNGVTTLFDRNNNNLKKLIIATHPNKQDEMLQHIIDPDGGKKIIEIDGDYLIYDYYSPLVRLIALEDSQIVKLPKMKKKFRIIYFDVLGCYIGILEEIYHIIHPFVVVDIPVSNLIEQVDSVLDELTNNPYDSSKNENISLEIDGIVAFDKSIEFIPVSN